MRKLLSVVVGAGLLVSLAACSSAPAGFASCTAGENASLVTATGAQGSDPKATFPTPLISESSDLAVLEKGDGAVVARDAGTDANVSIYKGSTGDPVIDPAVPLRLFVSTGIFPFATAFECATVGSRVALTGSVDDLLGETAEGLGLEGDDTIVIVADIADTFLGKANGADQLPQSGFPSVVLAPDGRPGVTFPAGEAPTDLKIAALKQGSGATVAEDDAVIINQAIFDWESRSALLDGTASSWVSGGPKTIVASDTSIAKGLAEALIGQKVGSQLIVIAPPEFGYPAGTAPTGVTEGSTLVFVVDILGID